MKIRKSQVVITSFVVLLAIVGYLCADKTLHAAPENTEVAYDIFTLAEYETQELNPGESVLTSTVVDHAGFASNVKMNREQIRSKNIELLQGIIDDASLTEEQKTDAVNKMVQMTDAAKKEADAEMMLEAKGFQNVVVSIGDESCDVVIDANDVTDAKRAQVEDIVNRKTGIPAEQIVITTFNETN